MKKAYESISFAPPSAVQAAARRGADLHAEFKRGGTAVGVTRATQLARGDDVSPQTVKRMHSYFARHEVDKQGTGWADRKAPSNGYIAWLLWGGDPGKRWADTTVRKMERADAKPKAAKRAPTKRKK